jgi:SAM-dependent methyltransferase
MPTKEEAMTFPTGDVELALCRECGFIFNTRYDPGLQHYCDKYEETQGFSPCFNTFLVSLVRKLISQYDIRGKDVLEIGCGKGDFLTLLCELGDNRGVGIDPSYIPARTDPQALSKVTFIRDFYGEKYANLAADVICCRHTLEHIGQTRQFMQMMMDSMAARQSMVFFEVPDVLRVLREGAFWDIYYEHCSYFTTGSLARLFRSVRLNPVELYMDYDDQYVMMMAKHQSDPTARPLPPVDDVSEIAQAVASFTATSQQTIQTWGKVVRELAAQGKKTVLWGSGSKGVAFLTTLKLRDEVQYVVDVNPYRHGKFMPGTGQEIVAPQFLTAYKPDCVIIMNPVYHQEISRNLQEMNVKAHVMAV